MLRAFNGVPPERIAEQCELVKRATHMSDTKSPPSYR
jgi:hypothetical protein